MNLLQTIHDIVSCYPDKEIYFSREVVVNINQHQDFIIHAISVENGIWLMDGEGKWHGPLEENQINADKIILALYKRLKRLQLKAA